ncbi:MAG TPA: hypothetical protein VLM89_16850 [Phycisphaerae bacterium]|nr:hypothetical protein [Phycisphaerae bacterium]
MVLTVAVGCQQPAMESAATSRLDGMSGATKKWTRGGPRAYPLDRHGFSPVDKKLAAGGPVEDDAAGSLNPYVLRVVDAYPLDGSYPYHADFKEPEYDIYNGVTQDMWHRGYVVAKAHPDGSQCSYCCGLKNLICEDVADYIRRAQERHLGEDSFPLHKYLHHGLSSQAMAFNLIGPLIVRNDLAPLKTAIEKLGVPSPEGKVRAVFEHDERSVFKRL